MKKEDIDIEAQKKNYLPLYSPQLSVVDKDGILFGQYIEE